MKEHFEKEVLKDKNIITLTNTLITKGQDNFYVQRLIVDDFNFTTQQLD